MLTLTLYDGSSPPKPIQSRNIGEDLVRVGRGPDADWVIEDPDRLTSRHHLDMRASGALLLVRARGRHNIYTGIPPRKVSKETETEVQAGESFSIGMFRMVVEEYTESKVVDNAEAPATVTSPSVEDYTLFDAFCAGAELDPSQFIADDPARVLREAGAVYREAITSLSKLLRSRTEMRADILADRTMIGSHENNLLKWAPSHRVVVDLLTNKQDAFLAGAKAVKYSFEDLDSHITGLLAGHRAAFKELLESLKPSVLEAQTPRGVLRDRAAESWETYKRTYASLEYELSDIENELGTGFAQGYEQSARRKRA